MRRLQLAMVTGLVCLPAAAQDRVPAPLAQASAADVESGGRLYATYCSRCHGFDGTGGMGPPLARPRLRHASDEAGIIGILVDGIPGTAMMAAWSLSEHEIAQVAAFVRTLGRRPEEKLPGDPARGRIVYGRLGCSSCHILDGVGAGVGPDLSDVGALRGAAFLRESLLHPGAALPQRAVPYEPYAYPAYLLVRAQPPAGPEVTGVLLNEDSFTVQLRDQQGRLHSLRKAELRLLVRESGTSLMPSYRGMLEEEALDDLVSYLMTRGGVR
jgi:cytochrome c oxidase cbb3-type subunit III